MTAWQTTRRFSASAHYEFLIVCTITQSTKTFIFMKEIEVNNRQIPDELHGPQFGLKGVDMGSLDRRPRTSVGDGSFNLWD